MGVSLSNIVDMDDIECSPRRWSPPRNRQPDQLARGSAVV